MSGFVATAKMVRMPQAVAKNGEKVANVMQYVAFNEIMGQYYTSSQILNVFLIKNRHIMMDWITSIVTAEYDMDDLFAEENKVSASLDNLENVSLPRDELKIILTYVKERSFNIVEHLNNIPFEKRRVTKYGNFTEIMKCLENYE